MGAIQSHPMLWNSSLVCGFLYWPCFFWVKSVLQSLQWIRPLCCWHQNAREANLIIIFSPHRELSSPTEPIPCFDAVLVLLLASSASERSVSSLPSYCIWSMGVKTKSPSFFPRVPMCWQEINSRFPMAGLLTQYLCRVGSRVGALCHEIVSLNARKRPDCRISVRKLHVNTHGGVCVCVI